MTKKQETVSKLMLEQFNIISKLRESLGVCLNNNEDEIHFSLKKIKERSDKIFTKIKKLKNDGNLNDVEMKKVTIEKTLHNIINEMISVIKALKSK